MSKFRFFFKGLAYPCINLDQTVPHTHFAVNITNDDAQKFVQIIGSGPHVCLTIIIFAYIIVI